MKGNKDKGAGQILDITTLSIMELLPHMDLFIGKLKEAKTLTNYVKYSLLNSPACGDPLKPTTHKDKATKATGFTYPFVDEVYYPLPQAAKYMSMEIDNIIDVVQKELLSIVRVSDIECIPEKQLNIYQTILAAGTTITG